ncbi:MAG: glycerol-3-phosphate acyltransferase PlsY [Planctomycetota bacterium]|jgi:glycerol-3-phosphate acyltransferase PlsY
MEFLATSFSDGLAWRVLAAYLLGGVPFGFMLCRLIKGVDLRTVGSGNIGATNAMRVLGKPLGLLAFFLDTFKGYAPVAFMAGSDPSWQVACGAAAVCGHVWPVYLKFKGGKAVATGIGAILAFDPLVVAISGLVWILTMALMGYVSLSSIAMGLAFPLAAWSRGQPPVVIFGTALLTLLILVRHRSNMRRLIAGEESRTQLWSKIRGRTTPANKE